MRLLIFRKHPDNVQKTLQTHFSPLPRTEGAAIKPFPGGEVPLAPKRPLRKGTGPSSPDLHCVSIDVS